MMNEPPDPEFEDVGETLSDHEVWAIAVCIAAWPILFFVALLFVVA